MAGGEQFNPSPVRHPELVSGYIGPRILPPLWRRNGAVSFQSPYLSPEAQWILKRVQDDELGEVAL